MTLAAVSLSRIHGGEATPPKDVLFAGDGFEVFGVPARPVPAEVVDLKALLDRTHKFGIDETVDVPQHAVDVDSSIPIPIGAAAIKPAALFDHCSTSDAFKGRSRFCNNRLSRRAGLVPPLVMGTTPSSGKPRTMTAFDRTGISHG